MTATMTVTDIPADGGPELCKSVFRVRADAAESLTSVRAEIFERRGVMTSSGGLRRLDAEVHAGRSPVSLHYLGRAVDLCIDSGMKGRTDPYVILRDGGDEERPRWRVYAVGKDEPERHLDAQLWQAELGTVTTGRTGRFFDLTEIFHQAGWSTIPARPGWRGFYLCVEWWHFEWHQGLEPGITRFGDELERLYPRELLESSAVAAHLDRIWDGRWFAPSGS